MAGTYRFLAINDINNGILKAPKAMPQKDITSNNENTFSIELNFKKEISRILLNLNDENLNQ